MPPPGSIGTPLGAPGSGLPVPGPHVASPWAPPPRAAPIWQQPNGHPGSNPWGFGTVPFAPSAER
ncbi:hypothetical protein FRC08_010906 [Ceratobasidium sp. 394]|nr:hypothetical protein FRC08_010906 [Ceratobasidium sp. 394]